MKNSLYIYETVKYYRNILDGIEIDDENIENTKKLFNRGYSKGYFYGISNDLINEKYSSDFGYKIGEYDIRKREIILEESIVLGDGITFVNEQGSIIKGEYVNLIEYKGEKQKKAYPLQRIKIGNIPYNTKYIYKNFDKELNENILKEIKQKKRKKGIRAEINIITGEKLNLKLYSNEVDVDLYSDVVNLAEKKILKEEDISSKISELGETPFELENIKINYDKKGFVSFAMLKDIKRKCAEELEEKLKKYYKRDNDINKKNIEINKNEEKKPIISASVLNKNQYDILKKIGIDKIYYKNKPIKKENEKKFTDELWKNECFKLTSNIEDIIKTKEKISIDTTFNVFNSYALEYLSKFKEKIDTVYLSTEMSYEEIKNIKSNKLNIGLVVYGKQQLMYIESKLFEKDMMLVNEKKDNFHIKINENKNTEIYTEKPLNILTQIDKMGKEGIAEVRLDFTFENEKEIENIVNSIRKLSGNYFSYNYEKGVL